MEAIDHDIVMQIMVSSYSIVRQMVGVYRIYKVMQTLIIKFYTSMSTSSHPERICTLVTL